MRVEPGAYRCEGTDGRTFHCERPLSREQADLLLAVIDRHGLSTERTVAVELNEGETRVEYLRWNDDGVPYVDKTSPDPDEWEPARAVSVLTNAR